MPYGTCCLRQFSEREYITGFRLLSTVFFYNSAFLNRNCKNPFEIAFGARIFALQNSILTVCAVYSQVWAELLRFFNFKRKDGAGAGHSGKPPRKEPPPEALGSH